MDLNPGSFAKMFLILQNEVMSLPPGACCSNTTVPSCKLYFSNCLISVAGRSSSGAERLTKDLSTAY